jgi:DNA-binding phage protein
MRNRTHDEAMAELFKQDPAYAVEMLNSILEDGYQGELLIALRQMTKTFGGVQTVAEKAELNPTQLLPHPIRTGQPGTAHPLRHPQSHGLAPRRRTGQSGVERGYQNRDQGYPAQVTLVTLHLPIFMRDMHSIARY